MLPISNLNMLIRYNQVPPFIMSTDTAWSQRSKSPLLESSIFDDLKKYQDVIIKKIITKTNFRVQFLALKSAFFGGFENDNISRA